MGISGCAAKREAPRGWALVSPPNGLRRPLLVRPPPPVLPLHQALASIGLAVVATHVLLRRQQRRQGQKRQRFRPHPWQTVQRCSPAPAVQHQLLRRKVVGTSHPRRTAYSPR